MVRHVVLSAGRCLLLVQTLSLRQVMVTVSLWLLSVLLLLCHDSGSGAKWLCDRKGTLMLPARKRLFVKQVGRERLQETRQRRAYW